MLQIVADTIQNYHMLDDCSHLIVGVSGGADSVCLLSVLRFYIAKQHLPIQLHVAHVNHCLRGAQADADEAQVTELCKQWALPLYKKCCDVKALAQEQGISLEMAGRDVRYAFFQEIAQNFPDCKIAVAHNQDDRAETVLWNMIRGTGVEGLKGISYVRGNIIRPLLNVSKDAIRQYCMEHKLPICEDVSNQERIYNRNKIRLDLIPYMSEMFDTDMTEKIIRMSDNVALDDGFLQEMVEKAKAICVKQDGAIDVALLLQQHVAIQRRLLQQCCNHQLQQVHLQGLMSFLNQNQTGKQFSLPGNLMAKLQYGMLYIQKQGMNVVCPAASMQISYEVYSATEPTKAVSNTAMEQIYDYDLLLEQCGTDGNGICIRTRQEGDLIRPFRGRGSKSLKKFFIDRKISREERDALPLLVMGQEVLWIPGYCRCSGYLPTKETKRILKVYTKLICN